MILDQQTHACVRPLCIPFAQLDNAPLRSGITPCRCVRTDSQCAAAARHRGPSGCPILGFADEVNRVSSNYLIAIQSSWLPDPKILSPAGCRLSAACCVRRRTSWPVRSVPP